MVDNISKAAKEFSLRWKCKGYEKGQSQPFWLDLLQNVFGIQYPANFISFEGKVKLAHTSFIDGYIKTTKVLIEQKSISVDLRKPIMQSDGTLLTPFQQAKRYVTEMPVSDHPKWVVVCNFETFLIYDMDEPQGEPFEILLENLDKEYGRLNFLVSNGVAHLKKQEEITVEAGEIIADLYTLLRAQYHTPNEPASQKALNMLCVRLVFLFYCEDAGLFGSNHNAFYDYIKPFGTRFFRDALINLFKVLDTPFELRDKYIDEELNKFPYVNGGLFHDETPIEIPSFSENIVSLILEKCSESINWTEISPSIFGSVFETTLNPETRDNGAIHYTSIINIHKAIDNLFLNDIKLKVDNAKRIRDPKARKSELLTIQEYISRLNFLDPACGSGNFLTETYISLRRIENEIIVLAYEGEDLLTLTNPIKVSVGQFYGIEINDFAVSIAKTALWIAESQMWNETKNLIDLKGNFLPLHTNCNIINSNAITTDWNSLIDYTNLNYIICNPPFFGARVMSSSQKDDLTHLFPRDWKNVGELDYVCCWFYKAYLFMLNASQHNNSVKAAFVATNSVSQGELVANLWKPLMNNGCSIDFAYKSFKWYSEVKGNANVHCVVIGFSLTGDCSLKTLVDTSDNYSLCDNINAYLMDAPDFFIESRPNPICDVPQMNFGNMPNDGGYLSKIDKSTVDDIVRKQPQLRVVFRRIIGAEEFLSNKERWCIWLKDISPSVYANNKFITSAIQAVRQKRLSSKRKSTQKLADTPTLFAEIRQPDCNYLLVPQVTSEKRIYVPMGFISYKDICTNLVNFIPDASLYHFGILQSIVHMAWMRAFCGRLETRYRYSIDIVYNNFPWPSPTDSQKQRIEETASNIIKVRNRFSDCNLKTLYGEFMPPELLKAHRANDKAVMDAYGLNCDASDEFLIVEFLTKLYASFI